MEGTDVYLDCDIRAHPAAYKVVWMHNVSGNIYFGMSNPVDLFNDFFSRATG